MLSLASMMGMLATPARRCSSDDELDELTLVAVVATAWNEVIELLRDQKPGRFSIAIQGATQPVDSVSESG